MFFCVFAAKKSACVQSEACKALTDCAKAKWEQNEPDVSDDISCVVVFFKHGGLGAHAGGVGGNKGAQVSVASAASAANDTVPIAGL